MCFRKNKQVRLEKKEPNKYYFYLQYCKYIIKQPEFWLTVLLACIFIIIIILAIKESGSYFYYNRGIQ